MEELADAIEDAQYVNAISTQDHGPKPVLPWDKPSDEQLASWEESVRKKQRALVANQRNGFGQQRSLKKLVTTETAEGTTTTELNDENSHAHIEVPKSFSSRRSYYDAFTLEWVCSEPIGYFLFSQHIKETYKDYIRINFCEEAMRFRKTRGRRNRIERAMLIVKAYLLQPLIASESATATSSDGLANDSTEQENSHKDGRIPLSIQNQLAQKGTLPPPTEIVEYDLCRIATTCDYKLTPEEVKAMYSVNMDYPTCSESIVGLKGPVRGDIIDRVYKLDQYFPDTLLKESNKIAHQQHAQKTEKEESSRVPSSDLAIYAALHNNKEQSTTNNKHKGSKNRGTNKSLTDYSEENSDSYSSSNLMALPHLVRTTSVSDTNNTNLHRSHTDNELDISTNKQSEQAATTDSTSVIGASSTTTTLNRSKSAVGSATTDRSEHTAAQTKVILTNLCEKIRSKRSSSILNSSSEISSIVSIDMFDKAELVVLESLKADYWESFQSSTYYTKFKNFLWYRDRKVEPDDFLTMRILGRGGFGLVYACKKGTSGKLYALKVMNKRRIKIKKSESLCINERKALEAVNSKFVVNLNYSFHSKDDVYLVLDLMTGGDLGFHLHQRGCFSKAECLYYAARIMLGLQALHDEKYVYRDLKPENCLLDEEGRVKITDLGLATKISSNLHGAAGTRGYWAPEMLRRDANGKRLTYGHAVDWFSFGCCVAEFISGTNPFRSEAALNFGLEHAKQTKEKAIDYATVEMTPEFPSHRYDPDAADFCRRLLDKNDKTRLGANGCQEIMAHPWFKSVNWDRIITDRESPPFVPLRDINAASREEISTFPEDKAYQETVITEADEELYKDWAWTNPAAFSAEVIEVLIYERETGEPLVPIIHQGACCCAIL